MQASRAHVPSRPSHIYRWDAAQEKMVLHQVMEPSIGIGSKTVSGMELLLQGREAYLILTAFTLRECVNGTLQWSNASTNAEAVCEKACFAQSRSTAGLQKCVSECTGVTYSKGPASILQWDRVTRKFDRQDARSVSFCRSGCARATDALTCLIFLQAYGVH
jgi:hypothetical protein